MNCSECGKELTTDEEKAVGLCEDHYQEGMQQVIEDRKHPDQK